MRAAGPVRRDYPLLSTPELESVRKLMQVATIPVVELKSEGLNISLRR
jgi:oxaloacetate decarboxylase alpha subunit